METACWGIKGLWRYPLFVSCGMDFFPAACIVKQEADGFGRKK